MILATTIASVLVICFIIFVIVNLLLTTSNKLLPQGDVNISINDGSETISVKPGESILSAL